MRYLGLAILISVAPFAATSAQATPEAAAQALGMSLRANDWAAAARLMHPNALHQLRGLLEPLVSSAGGGEVTKQVFGIGSAAELAATPDTVLFATFLRTVMTQEGTAEVLKSAIVTPLGHITQPGDTVLVVSRMSMSIENLTITSFEVMPFLLYQEQYRGLLKADFTNLVSMLQARFGKGS